jgi:hypothetical protein
LDIQLQSEWGFDFQESVLMSRVELKDLVADAADLLVQKHGFTRTGRKFIRQDELVRSAWFRPTGFGRFELLFDLGIAGISLILPEKPASPGPSEKWVVGLNARDLRPKEVPAMAWLTLTKGKYDQEVRKHSRNLCERVADEFLLKYSSAEEFYQWVRGSALELLKDPNTDNEWRRLKLWPANPLLLFELAGVYAAHLGKSDDASMLRQAALDDAIVYRIDAIPRIITSIAEAGGREGRPWAMDKAVLVDELRKAADHGAHRGITASNIRFMLGRDFQVPGKVYSVPAETFLRFYRRRLGQLSPGIFEYKEVERLVKFLEDAQPSGDLEMLPVTNKDGMRAKTIVLVNSDTQSVAFWSTMWQF